MTLRSGKAAVPDGIPAEAIKADIETAVNRGGAGPVERRNHHQGVIKGDLRDCSN